MYACTCKGMCAMINLRHYQLRCPSISPGQQSPSTSNKGASMSVRSNHAKINHTANLHTDTMNRLL